MGLAFSQLNPNILYFCDSDNNCIRKVNILTKQVSTIAGNPNQFGFKDGIGNEAKFWNPDGICVDRNENLFVCDYDNHSIRKINFINNSNFNNSTIITQNEPLLANQTIVSTLLGNGKK